MKIEDIRLGMSLVTTGGLHGQVVAIEKEGGMWIETADRTRFPVHAECVERVDSPCEGCQMQDDRDFWKTTALQYQEQAHYWMQEWVDREMKPLAEVAKCCKQVEPEQLLLSEDAKIVCELLRSSGPASSFEISERLHMLEIRVFKSLIEAKEAGIVRLDDGKYSIVRD